MRHTQNYMSIPFNPQLQERAKSLRKAGNLPEVLLWNKLKRKQFYGLDFDRQKIIGNYIADFYCAEKQVVIEVDGSSHDNKVEYDRQRDAYLESLGLTVIHIPASDVKYRIGEVIKFLESHPALGDLRELGTTENGPRTFGTSENRPPRLSGTPPVEGNVE